jgi:hypothetical protein
VNSSLRYTGKISLELKNLEDDDVEKDRIVPFWLFPSNYIYCLIGSNKISL